MGRQRRSRERVGGWSYSIGGTDGVGRVRKVRAEVEMLGSIVRVDLCVSTYSTGGVSTAAPPVWSAVE
jgi:hypothetical protein